MKSIPNGDELRGLREAMRTGSVLTCYRALMELAKQQQASDVVGEISELVAARKYDMQNTYLHENGYLKIVLEEINGMRLRVNVWGPGQLLDSNAHNHRWDFCSWVVTGALKWRTFNLGGGTQGELWEECRYIPRSGSSDYSVEYVGAASLVQSMDAEVSAGTVYLQDQRTIHQAGNAGNSRAVSLMITGVPLVTSKTNLFTQKPVSEIVGHYKSEHASHEQVTEIFRSVEGTG